MASRTVIVRYGADDSRVMFDWNCGNNSQKYKPPIQILTLFLISPWHVTSIVLQNQTTFLSSTMTVSWMARGEKQCVGSGYSGNTSPGAAAIIMALKWNQGKLTNVLKNLWRIGLWESKTPMSSSGASKMFQHVGRNQNTLLFFFPLWFLSAPLITI